MFDRIKKIIYIGIKSQKVAAHYRRWPYYYWDELKYDANSHDHVCFAAQQPNVDLAEVCPYAKQKRKEAEWLPSFSDIKRAYLRINRLLGFYPCHPSVQIFHCFAFTLSAAKQYKPPIFNGIGTGYQSEQFIFRIHIQWNLKH